MPAPPAPVSAAVQHARAPKVALPVVQPRCIQPGLLLGACSALVTQLRLHVVLLLRVVACRYDSLMCTAVVAACPNLTSLALDWSQLPGDELVSISEMFAWHTGSGSR